MTDYELTWVWLAIGSTSAAIVGGIVLAVETVWAGRRRFPR